MIPLHGPFLRVIFLLFWAGHICFTAAGQVAAPEALTIDQGLSQGMIYDVLQTKDGFLWVGTKDGLNRYDGYNFKVWSNNPYYPFTLSDNTVTALLEDSRGWLWLGSESQGVSLFDRKSERFYHVNLPIKIAGGNQVLSDVRCIIEDRKGRIWIANRGAGIYCLTMPENGQSGLPDTSDISKWCTLQVVQLPHPKRAGADLQEEFSNICETKDGTLWAGSSRGVYQIDPQTLEVVYSTIAPDPYSKEANGIIQTVSGEIWGVNQNGIFTYKNRQYNHYDLGINKEIGTAVIIKSDPSGTLWALFERNLWRIDPDKPIDFSRPEYVLDKPANTFSIDRQGNIWVGTLGYGLRKIVPRKAMFNTTLKGTSIWGVWQDKQGRVLCKLFNKIVAFDPVTQQVSQQSAFPDALPQQNDLLYEPSGDCWLLCGLRDEKANKSELRRYRPDRSLAAVYDIAINRYPYARLLRTADGRIWVSGKSGRLLRCDPATGKMDVFDFGRLFGNQATAVQTIALVEDGNGTIWAGTQLGLVECRWSGDSLGFKLFKTTAGQKNVLNNNSIACLLPDPSEPGKRLWIGTKGGGINCLDLRTGDMKYITTDQGLPNNVVYGMLPDASGRLWCSTNRGIFRLTMQGEKVADVKVFTQADGLQNNEFNTQAFFKTAGGEMLFGGVDGLNRFSPELLELNNTPPPVRIVGIEINHQPARFSAFGGMLPHSPEYLQEITLEPDRNNLSFEFTALDFTDPAKNHYRYKLSPIETDWVEAGARHFAHYTHLAPGTYTFQVKASNNDGAWNEEAVEMRVIVLPPWWKTNLAKFLYLVLACAIGWLIYREHVRSIRLKARVVFEQRERERIRALEQMKTNFFSNVAHEFRTPLTLIIEPLRQVLKKPDESGWLSKIGLAARNSQKLLQLVNELLDLAKLESGAMQPEYRTGMIGDIVRPVAESFTGSAENKGIDLLVNIHSNVQGDFDAGKLEKICFNLISNALKFTPSGGEVLVSVQAVSAENTGKKPLLKITVADTGRGISKADLPHVFERFYQAHETAGGGQPGTGIGLALCRELTELMGGKISAESEPGRGSTFQVLLPLRQRATRTGETEQTALESPLPALPMLEEKDLLHHTSPPQPAGRPLLLLAEDNEELRAFLYQTLSESCEVIEAPDGKRAIELARQRVPDIVVSDIFMPHVDGIELLDMLKRDLITSHIPVLLLTSKTALENRLEGLQHGADAYLGKPFQTEELLAWISNLLETRRRLQERFTRPAQASGTPGHAAILEDDAPSQGATLSALDHQFLDKLRQVAEQEIENEHFSVEELARQMTMSRSQLHRKMSAITGQSTGEFLRNFRLDRAMELLQTKSGNVSEIAWRVGFGNAKYFSTSFKERFGVSPSEVGEDK